MRFNKKPEPKVGDKKTVVKFAWLPTLLDGELNNGKCVVWLERYKAHYEFKKEAIPHCMDGGGFYSDGWLECSPWKQFYHDGKVPKMQNPPAPPPPLIKTKGYLRKGDIIWSDTIPPYPNLGDKMEINDELWECIAVTESMRPKDIITEALLEAANKPLTP